MIVHPLGDDGGTPEGSGVRNVRLEQFHRKDPDVRSSTRIRFLGLHHGRVRRVSYTPDTPSQGLSCQASCGFRTPDVLLSFLDLSRGPLVLSLDRH